MENVQLMAHEFLVSHTADEILGALRDPAKYGISEDVADELHEGVKEILTGNLGDFGSRIYSANTPPDDDDSDLSPAGPVS